MPPISLLVKPASDICNLRCKYCFYCDVSKNRAVKSYGFMKETTLENMIKKALEYADTFCSIAYQGGEPTLVGLDFYKKSIEYEKKYNKKNITIHNSIQTNGYNLNKEWAKFFHENDFLVGISLDGIKDTHDKFRTKEDGQGTFYEVLKTIELFKQYNVKFNILTVVNDKTSQRGKKIYEFYKRLDLKYLQFIACLDPLGCKCGEEDYSVEPREYGNFLCEIFDLWYNDLLKGKQPYIRQFENYISILMGLAPESCEQRGICSYNHVLEGDGEVYPCDFYVLDQYKLGNINHMDFFEIQRKRKDDIFVKESLNHSQGCKKCIYFSVCRGGCRRHRVIKNQDGTYDNYYCEGYKIFFNHSFEKLRKIAMKISALNNINEIKNNK